MRLGQVFDMIEVNEWTEDMRRTGTGMRTLNTTNLLGCLSSHVVRKEQSVRSRLKQGRGNSTGLG